MYLCGLSKEMKIETVNITYATFKKVIIVAYEKCSAKKIYKYNEMDFVILN